MNEHHRTTSIIDDSGHRNDWFRRSLLQQQPQKHGLSEREAQRAVIDCEGNRQRTRLRIEDFAESVAMYVGWGRENDLSAWAKERIDRYLLEDGTKHKYFGVDNWAYYKTYFYPEYGDYTRTKRWKFMDDLVKGKISI